MAFTPEEQRKITSFFVKVKFIHLINSGKSNLSDVQDKKVAELYDLADDLMKLAFKRGNRELYDRIHKEAQTILPPVEAKKVMKHPEMYDSMVAAYENFKKGIKNTCITKKSMSL